MKPQDKKEIEFIFNTAKEILLFMATVIIGFIIVVNVFL